MVQRYVLMLVLATVLAAPVSAVAQMGHGGERRPPMDRLENLRKVRLIETLDLNEEQSARFVARLGEHEKKKREIQHARGEVLDRLDSLVRTNADSRELEKTFADMRALAQRIIDQEMKFHDGLSDILTPQQRARMFLFERKFDKELREAIRDAARRRGPGAP